MCDRNVVIASRIERLKRLLKNGERTVVAEAWMNIVITVAGAGQNTILRGQSSRSCGAQARADSNSDSRRGNTAESLRVMYLDPIQPGSDQHEAV